VQEWEADKAPPQPKAKRGSVLYRRSGISKRV